MSHVNVGEDDFDAVANAARDALARGDRRDAERLDKLARKINAALGAGSTRRAMGPWIRSMQAPPLTWREVPSVLEPPI